MFSLNYYRNFYTEALRYDTVKTYLHNIDYRDNPLYTEPINSVFEKQAKPQKNGGRYRIYINNIDVNVDDLIESSPLFYNIKRILKKQGYHIDPLGYIENKAVNTKRSNQIEKISKILNRINEIELLKSFNSDPLRQVHGNYKIVISRHPYDIVGMSTDRHWTSCMDLGVEPIVYRSKKDYKDMKPGVYSDKLEQDVKNGTLIAYLISPKDDNINKPLARILAKPYKRRNKIYYYVSSKTYGVQIDELKNVFSEWIQKNINTNKYTGVFKASKGLYIDDDPDELEFGVDITTLKKLVKKQIPDEILKNALIEHYVETNDVTKRKELYITLKNVFANGMLQSAHLRKPTTEIIKVEGDVITLYNLTFTDLIFNFIEAKNIDYGQSVKFDNCLFNGCDFVVSNNFHISKCSFLNATLYVSPVFRIPFIQMFNAAGNLLGGNSFIKLME